ncbi:MAG: hybrid sensor histidine kinase/response regulator [Elusimicrobia bacterium]|nr:hybrid sensor histidine kinase/response regulator [Elusimicrobiota bacterium]
MPPPELVLVADDEEEDRRFLVELVREEGLEVCEARNGSQAAELLEQKPIDLILTDLVMPGLTGFELMRLARQRDPEIICIALTSFGSLESALDALRHGAYTYLLKPCDAGTVRNCLQRGLEKLRLTRELRRRNQELEGLNRSLDARVQQATEELRALNQRMLTEMASLREVDRLKSAFLANVSHDLKSPMTTVMGYAQFLLEEGAPGLSSEQQKCLGNLRRAAQHMQYLVSQLVEAARLTSGKVSLALQPIAAAELVEEAAALLRQQAEEKGVGLVARWEGAAPDVFNADRGRLRQVLSNLLGNALKFTAKGGRIGLRAWSDGGRIHFCVEDSGIGMETRHLTRIFERFYQVDASPSRTFRGLGLGLCIAKEIVNLHGGRIWAESEPGRGSRFHVEIPPEGPGPAGPP